MGLFNKIFGASGEAKEEKVLPWIPLNAIQQLDLIKEKSGTKTQIIFKHSTRCGISRMVMKPVCGCLRFYGKGCRFVLFRLTEL